MSEINTMLLAAQKAITNSYSPYSKFAVACCIKSVSGKLYTGCNVENASYSLTTCAEAAAISNMVTAGETKIAEVLIIAHGDLLCSPCGACRQRIREFAGSNALIHMGNPHNICKTMTLEELLPLSFGPENLEK